MTIRRDDTVKTKRDKENCKKEGRGWGRTARTPAATAGGEFALICPKPKALHTCMHASTTTNSVGIENHAQKDECKEVKRGAAPAHQQTQPPDHMRAKPRGE
jgi:hypothetical protein